ncbi:ChaC-like protein [Nesidiocoris tenuis]|uniref:glutathione-specific gamma-glutamylcyclotransferase n=1 Tax=Nesidiocoris tenuis TaxID=355587 RepID=A0ABN7AMA7_9HEMI|nr:ChaC-like protein [Nesidiocoris tenuis]
MWLFGYGSLIWKVDFPIRRRVVGYIKGYVRRFYQGSPEHRGAPLKPGRVVTLLPSSNCEDVVWGVAYEIRKEDVAGVVDSLDVREKSGYEKKTVTFYPTDDSIEDKTPFDLTVYIADPKNEWYREEPDMKTIAAEIAECRGMSGPNAEYLFKLADAVRQMTPQACDPHLFELEAEVKRIVEEKQKP